MLLFLLSINILTTTANYFVKENATCFRPYGFVGFQICKEDYELLDTGNDLLSLGYFPAFFEI
jgi:hypothetical protein